MNEVIENNGANNVEVEEGTLAAKAEETKAEKFIRLGEYRMNKAIDAIGRLEHLANKSVYEYTHRSRWKPCSLRWSYGWQM